MNAEVGSFGKYVFHKAAAPATCGAAAEVPAQYPHWFPGEVETMYCPGAAISTPLPPLENDETCNGPQPVAL
jgi:hypothetical protein